MRLTLFHQSAFVLHGGGTIAVDLGYEVPGEVVAELAVDASIVTHKHPDHLHLPHLEALGAPVFGPQDVIQELAALDVPQTEIRPGDIFMVKEISVIAFESDHGPNLSSEIDNLGLVFSTEEKSLLCLGDMAVPSAVPVGPWDLILAPVGGSKVFTPEAAVEFVSGLGHTGRVIPIHFHGRADRTAGEQFRSCAAGVCNVELIDVGQTLEV